MCHHGGPAHPARTTLTMNRSHGHVRNVHHMTRISSTIVTSRGQRGALRDSIDQITHCSPMLAMDGSVAAKALLACTSSCVCGSYMCKCCCVAWRRGTVVRHRNELAVPEVVHLHGGLATA